MGVRMRRDGQTQRMATKTLDSEFLRQVRDGLACSPFEAEAVLGVVRDVYFPYLGVGSQALPGTVSLVVVGADEPAGKPLEQCEKTTVCLQVHRGNSDDQLLERDGAEGFRRARIPQLCQEAISQGGVLTREDLAWRIFYVSPRTISRDLEAIRKDNPQIPVPLRSIRQDIGPTLTHRVEIVRLALAGKTTTEICRIMHHSPQAVGNYLSTFARVAQLAQDKNTRITHKSQIAFILRRSEKLIGQYLELLGECQTNPNYSYHLQQMLELAQVVPEKKTHQTVANRRKGQR